MQFCHILNSMHILIKLTHSYDVFVCYFIDVVNVFQLDLYLYRFYFDPYTKFDDPTFDEFKALESFTTKNLLMSLCEYLNGEEADCFIIEFVSAKFSMNQHCLTTSALKFVLRPYFPLVMAHPKSSCENFAWALVLELEVKFPKHELVLALGVVYLNSRLKTHRMLRMISTSAWLWSRLRIVTNGKWERMGCGWMLCLIHMNWICSACFLRWPWLQIVSWCWKRCWIKTRLWAKITSFPILKIKLLDSLSWLR